MLSPDRILTNEFVKRKEDLKCTANLPESLTNSLTDAVAWFWSECVLGSGDVRMGDGNPQAWIKSWNLKKYKTSIRAI